MRITRDLLLAFMNKKVEELTEFLVTIDLHIEVASDLVDDISKLDPTISPKKLEILELYVGAHLIASTVDRQETVIDYGTTKNTLNGDLKYIDFRSTTWGQHALSRDSTGYLKNLGKLKDIRNSFLSVN